jgi:hypothetical protein
VVAAAFVLALVDDDPRLSETSIGWVAFGRPLKTIVAMIVHVVATARRRSSRARDRRRNISPPSIFGCRRAG